MTEFLPDKKLLRRRLGKYGVEATLQLLTLQEADFGGKGTKEETTVFAEIRRLLDEILAEDACLTVQDLKVDGRDLLGLGFPAGKILGACLSYLLEQVQDEQIPNEKDALTLAATAFLQKNTEK
jgi:tRNA nucleotidyltransferase (CCA-adding enzyme)